MYGHLVYLTVDRVPIHFGLVTGIEDAKPIVGIVSNQQKWDSVKGERTGVGWGSGELPEGPVVESSPLDRLSLHLLPAL